MSDSDFGGIIRAARDGLGLSQTRVAELVGRSPSTVRAWERGRSVPNEATVVSSLAAVLGLEERSLFEAAGLTPPGTRPTPTLEQTLSEITPIALPPEPVPPEPVDPGPEPDATPPDGRHRVAASGEDDDIRVVETPAVSPPITDQPQEPAGPSPIGEMVSKIGGAVAALPERLRRRRPSRPKVSMPPQAVSQHPPPPSPPPPMGGVGLLAAPPAPSYIEDPEQRLIYRFRAVLLAAGAFLLVVVFVWAMANFFDAVGESISAILGSE